MWWSIYLAERVCDDSDDGGDGSDDDDDEADVVV